MTNRYKRELEQLADVYRAAHSIDVSEICRLVERLSLNPLTTVGSGGSYSTASFAASLHEYRTGQLARPATPLEIIATPPRRTGTLCFSASGRNRDIGVAFQIAAQAEAGPVGALVLADDTPLHALQSRYAYTDVVGSSAHRFKDGFLAVASMVGSALLLKRAYDAAFGERSTLPPSLQEFAEKTIASPTFGFVETAAKDVIGRSYLSLLYSPFLVSTAIDLESRFVEAALGAIHTADFRNFGHGRHHWMAKRGEETGVIALAGKQHKTLASRTLDLIPEDVAIWRLDIAGEADEQAIAGLIAGLYLSAAAGAVVGIDPAKPGVPGFGRKLYNLGPGALKRRPSEINRKIAIQRKAPEVHLNASVMGAWNAAYDRALHVWEETCIAALAFDYDGTLCDSRNRFGPLSGAVSETLTRVLEQGMSIGVATGRGPSAGVALRNCLPKRFWPGIVMGYYNGAVLTHLDDDRDPLVGPCGYPGLVEALSQHPVLRDCDIRANEVQIALRLKPYLDVGETLSVVNALLSDHGLAAPVTASSHAVDIQFRPASKLAVVKELQNRIEPPGVIMRLGDKGVWPGNDAEFLDSPFGLSVDEASRHSEHCWALAPAGVKGVQATLYYLKNLIIEDGVGRLRVQAGDRGNVYAS
ncbi:HAD hydrolase family protein [Henriciella aquimarina]|uniref:HAD hydrolase family protein n=1 Tax=Henriciella aquimarina TaxID=545261 RepID=UPI000A0597F8|nr:HAD hydrolase family protein [Henriciella aquimarina]